MAALGNYRIMKPLKDEDRWFKFFTKKQLAFAATGLVLSFVSYGFFDGIGLRVVGLFVAETIMCTLLILAFLKLPFQKYLIGGGRYAHEILWRLIVKSMPRNKVIYTKNYEQIEEE